MDKLKHYVELFNSNDEETHINLIDNANAYEWLKREIPRLECPDEDIERTYYFRFWTYRKHVKLTEDGYVISEFLPEVPWSGKHNVINAAVGHHLYEGRWLASGNKYLTDYVSFLLNTPDRSHQYSAWLCYAILKMAEVFGKENVFTKNLLVRLCQYYKTWEETHQLKNGMFWSIDNHDAMEFSISGTTSEQRVRRGIRPTLNSYLCADAYAIAEIARYLGDEQTASEYLKKHETLKKQINDLLFEDGFYRAYHYDNEYEINDLFEKSRGTSPREEIGYIPWMFNIPEKKRESVFSLLIDENSFYTDFGIATAERRHERFLYDVNHECLWNGYVWPFATSQTLTALINIIDNYNDDESYKKLFRDLVIQYAKSHERVREDGKHIPWIDEVRHPLRDDWSSRTLLCDWGWPEQKGGYERGKDYNHSTFCDLVISGLIGIKTDRDELYAMPNIPEDWEWFKLSNLHYKGSNYTVIYDKNGEKYGLGKGLQIIKEN